GRSPGPGAVAMHGWAAVENGIDDTPCRLDGILAREERRIADKCVAEEALIGLHLHAFLVVNEELDARPDHRRSRLFRARTKRNRHVPGTESKAEVVSGPRRGSIENLARRTAQRDADFGRRHRQTLADANLKRNTLPPPGVDRKAHRSEGLDLRLCGYSGLAPVAVVLAAHKRSPGERADPGQHLDAFVAKLEMPGAGRRVHREIGEHLQHVILHDVAHRSQLLVQRAATLDAEFLGHRDLHARDERAIPHRLEKRVGEPEIHQVLDGFLAQEMIDPEHRFLVEHLVDDARELSCRSEIAAERFFDAQPAARARRPAEPTNYGREHAGWNREIADGQPRTAERDAEPIERRGIAVVAVDVSDPSRKGCEGSPVDSPVLPEAAR